MKLNNKNLPHFSSDISRPAYDVQAVKTGIAHIGVGGFHRAHLAFYMDKLLADVRSNEWGICGIGLRPEDKKIKQALQEQDFFYTLFELSDASEKEVRITGSIREFYLAEDELDKVLDNLSSPAIKIVSLTITEGGYCTDDSTGEFLSHLPIIQHDLQNPLAPQSVFGVLTEALRRRKENNISPFTVLSCDNLPHNGRVARQALLTFAGMLDQSLANWIASNVSFPNSMVDRITPATSKAHCQQLYDQYGIEDQWPVVCEPFTQWVVEDAFCNGRPEWEKVGVQFTEDVTPYENMKISLLNGSHLALTYLGTLLGYEFAHQTMQDPLLKQFVRTFMDEDVTPLLAQAPGIDFDEYKDTLIQRFSNPVICDQLTRISSDGSSKFPKFIFPTLLSLIKQGKPLGRCCLIVSAWAYYLAGRDEKGNDFLILDPRKEKMQKICQQEKDFTDEFLGVYEVFGNTIPASQRFVETFREQLVSLKELGVKKTIISVLEKC